MRYGLLTFQEPKPDFGRKILHVDMDAFYASVEIRNHPSLRNKPVVIAKHPNLTGGRGIVSTCNYIARQFGIHSAMSAMEAYRLCPQAVFIQGDMSYYHQVSMQIREIFSRYTDVIEPLSLDEAYLDVTQNKMGKKSALWLAYDIQKTIYKEMSLTCSIGVSYNKFLAKIASDYQKPSGITLVKPEDAINFLMQLPIEKFYGVGTKSVPHFQAKGIHTGQDLFGLEFDDLVREFGKIGKELYFRVRGIDDRPVNPSRERKSIGRERTFSQFILDDSTRVMIIFEELLANVHEKLMAKGWLASLVTIKIRYDDFETLTRQTLLTEPTADLTKFQSAVANLWEQHGNVVKSIRLLGVSLGHFFDPNKDAVQLTIEEEE